MIGKSQEIIAGVILDGEKLKQPVSPLIMK
jgi:hypothetical protein